MDKSFTRKQKTTSYKTYKKHFFFKYINLDKSASKTKKLYTSTNLLRKSKTTSYKTYKKHFFSSSISIWTSLLQKQKLYFVFTILAIKDWRYVSTFTEIYNKSFTRKINFILSHIKTIFPFKYTNTHCIWTSFTTLANKDFSTCTTSLLREIKNYFILRHIKTIFSSSGPIQSGQVFYKSKNYFILQYSQSQYEDMFHCAFYSIYRTTQFLCFFIRISLWHESKKTTTSF